MLKIHMTRLVQKFMCVQYFQYKLLILVDSVLQTEDFGAFWCQGNVENLRLKEEWAVILDCEFLF